MSGARIGGPVRMDPSAFVARGAVVAGDVRLGARSSVWFNSVLRGDSAPVDVGEDANIQDNSVVHEDEGFPTTIGARVTIGHGAIIHGCTIAAECLVGMGAIVLTGARIGTGSLIGAGALVREGQEIPAGSLVVGSPARIHGPVASPHREAIERGWTHYRDLSRLYLARGQSRPVDRDGAIVADREPMSLARWEQALEALAALPARVEAAHPGAAMSAGLVSGWVARDRLRRACVEALRRGATFDLEPGAVAAVADTPFDAWREERAALVDRLRPGDEDLWNRTAGHPQRGPFTLAQLALEWVEEDLDALRRARSGVEARWS